ncbi:MAG TPA: four helix bundle protein [Gemmatimonadaceae bacterium]|nr:four helix bundle protein [Gemmatimonadaceae bacterium]
MEVPPYDEWEKQVPLEIQNDPIWGLRAYRTALWFGQVVHEDARALSEIPIDVKIAQQLAEAGGAISADLSEGYGRSSPRERAHFYEYAVGSAREARSWYMDVAHDLPAPTLAARLSTLTALIRIITALINHTRRKRRRDP